jgi:hypothetical protein
MAYYDHRHSGIYETNILKAIKQTECKTNKNCINIAVQMESANSWCVEKGSYLWKLFTEYLAQHCLTGYCRGMTSKLAASRLVGKAGFL